MYPIEDYIINFLARKESQEDAQKLKEWLAADPANRNELKRLLAAWDTVGMKDAIKKIDSEKAYHRFMFRAGVETAPKTVEKSRIKLIYPTISRVAAIFIISFSLGILSHYYWANNPSGQLAFIENIVPLGSQSEVRLPDGSTVSLNAGSTLRYHTDYGKSKRDVYLEGEGYFSVAHNDGRKKMPFTVYTPLVIINALGTEFNVKAYPDENVVETTLIKGEVTVENGEAGKAINRAISLKSGQKLSVAAPELNLEPVITQLEQDIAAAVASWKERDWRFEREPLQDLAIKLERRYNVRIHIDEELKDQHYTGTLRDESMEQILRAIQLSAPIVYNIEGKDIYIHVDKKKME